ncbi:cysteine hydrolase family protein [Pseudomonas sp. NBRC 100443]|uniref:cysteine hydrolase family protein n=1 Tax=Pseudomonas sp. NBRC 100443 TaxID=1113665 RepID=UPI0024A41BA5|nr:cysteine hydrolase family protein [Pseudomonas sp. NBRC 100443]GLU41131.1 isochorismatase [Pseudomonas sp. NBRC 100443]
MSVALLVIDVQHALCGGADACFDHQGVVERINGLGRRARDLGLPVIFVQHEEPEGDFRPGSEGWQLAPALQVADGDPRVRKTTPDSFHGTELDALLRKLGVTGLVICGMQTDFCVDTTVRRALAEGYDVVLAGDAHSTLDNRVLRAEQIIAHHNEVFSRMSSFAPRLDVLPSAAVTFD